MFANNHHDDIHVAVRLPAGPGVQDAVIEEAPQIFSALHMSVKPAG